ncbi:EpsG family protein [Legionella lansingensis]|nr:EpsG family protein [Legionella lansingensis]
MKTRVTSEFFFLLTTAVLLVLAVGSRPNFVGSDTAAYANYYDRLHNHLSVYINYEYFFQTIAKLLTRFFSTPEFFFACIAIINCALITILVLKLSAVIEHKIETFQLFFLMGVFLLLSPFFFAVMANVIRHGTAILALFIFYVTLISRTNLLLLALSLIIALGFHYTSIIGIAFSPLLFLRYRAIFYLVLIMVCLYMSGLSERMIHFISTLTPLDLYSKIQGYRLDIGYKSGIRLDFALFTLAAGVISSGFGKYFLNADDRAVFFPLIKIYWVLVLPFFFFGFAAFSDRYLLSGWLFLSVLGAVFLGLLLRNYLVSARYLYSAFGVSTVYFLLRMQGLL